MEQSFDKILRPLNSLRLGFILGMLGLIPNFLILGTQQWRMLLLLLLFHVLGTTLIVLCSEIIYLFEDVKDDAQLMHWLWLPSVSSSTLYVFFRIPFLPWS